MLALSGGRPAEAVEWCRREGRWQPAPSDEGLAPETRLVASTLHTLVQLVDAGLGITLLPEIAISAGILSGTGVTSHAVAKVDAERRIALVWRRGHSREADFRLLGETIRGAVRPALQ